MKITVSVVDDHEMIAGGLITLLQDATHISVISSYNNAVAALEGLKQQQPDVLILDIHMPDTTGDVLAEKITALYPQVTILILTGFNSFIYLKKLLKIGVAGYLLKNTDKQTLRTAIETVYAGKRFIDPTLAAHFNDALSLKDQSEQKISQREKEVLSLIVKGHTSEQIAELLFLSHRTVENHRFHLMQKLGVKNTVTLVKAAMDMGIW